MSGQSFEGVGRWVIGILLFIGWAAAGLAAGTGVHVWLGAEKPALYFAWVAGWGVFITGLSNHAKQTFPERQA